MQVDGPLEVVREHRSSAAAPADLEEFWRSTLVGDPPSLIFTPVDNGLVAVETFDVELDGFGGAPVRGWLHLPAAPLRGDRLPGVLQLQGYNGGRGLAHEHVFWALAGYAHLVLDTRGQGSGWRTGATADPAGSAASQPGFLTRGIERPEDYYYRRVFTDAVRALEALRAHELVDPDRVAVAGQSQGGGMALAVAALAPTPPQAVLADVPFLCDFPHAARVAQGDPYLELTRYLKAHRDRAEQVFSTLAYFDGAVLAARATAPALFSVALMDLICPPSTVFAAYNAYAGPKEIEVYEFNDHEGGEAFHQRRQLEWLASVLA
jgi:cephalosporin-C deacetylase